MRFWIYLSSVLGTKHRETIYAVVVVLLGIRLVEEEPVGIARINNWISPLRILCLHENPMVSVGSGIEHLGDDYLASDQ